MWPENLIVMKPDIYIHIIHLHGYLTQNWVLINKKNWKMASPGFEPETFNVISYYMGFEPETSLVSFFYYALNMVGLRIGIFHLMLVWNLNTRLTNMCCASLPLYYWFLGKLVNHQKLHFKFDYSVLLHCPYDAQFEQAIVSSDFACKI